MLRYLPGSLVAFAFFTGVVLADDAVKPRKKNVLGAGEIVKVDAEKGTVTVKLGTRKKAEEKELKVTDRTAVTLTTTLKAAKVAELLRKEQFRAGATVTVEMEADGTTVKAITFTTAPQATQGKKKAAAANAGEIVRVDADKGTVTVKVGAKKKQTQEKEYRVTATTAVVAVSGANRTEVKANTVADLLKREQFRPGAHVAVEPGPDGTTARAITFTTKPEARKNKKKPANQ